MRVRDATVDDRHAIVAIYNHAIEHTLATFDLEPFSIGAREAWFEQFGEQHPQHPLLVCERVGDREVLGYAYYLPFRPKAAYVHTKEISVYTHPSARRQGVARLLYQVLFKRARAAGVHTLIAVLGGDNPASKALHESLGFAFCGSLPEVGRKHGQWVDTHYFQKALGD